GAAVAFRSTEVGDADGRLPVVVLDGADRRAVRAGDGGVDRRRQGQGQGLVGLVLVVAVDGDGDVRAERTWRDRDAAGGRDIVVLGRAGAGATVGGRVVDRDRHAGNGGQADGEDQVGRADVAFEHACSGHADDRGGVVVRDGADAGAGADGRV